MTRKRKITQALSPKIYKQVCAAIADTLEGLGVREVVALIGVEPVDQDHVRAAFDQVVREIRARGGKP